MYIFLLGEKSFSIFNPILDLMVGDMINVHKSIAHNTMGKYVIQSVYLIYNVYKHAQKFLSLN